MMQWRIKGLDRTTGSPKSITVEAETEREAIVLAAKDNCVVETVKEVQKSSPPAQTKTSGQTTIDGVSRGSGCLVFFLLLAILSLLSGVIGFLVLVIDRPIEGMVLAVTGLAGSVQLFFMAFCVDVLTDIRWYLIKINNAQHISLKETRKPN